MTKLWNKGDERTQEDKLRLAGFPPPDEPEGATVTRKLKMTAGPKAEQKKQKPEKTWDQMSSWDDDEGKEASSSWEPHSEGSEAGADKDENGEGGDDDGTQKKRKRGHRGGKKHRKWWNQGGKGANRWES